MEPIRPGWRTLLRGPSHNDVRHARGSQVPADLRIIERKRGDFLTRAKARGPTNEGFRQHPFCPTKDGQSAPAGCHSRIRSMSYEVCRTGENCKAPEGTEPAAFRGRKCRPSRGRVSLPRPAVCE